MKTAAVGVWKGAMTSLLGKLGELLMDKYNLIQGVEDEVRSLRDELEHMHDFLKTMSLVEEPSEQEKRWAKEIRELSYDMEDKIDEFMHHTEHDDPNAEGGRRPRGWMVQRFKNFLITIYDSHGIAKEIQGLKRRAMDVNERRLRYSSIADDSVANPNISTVIDPRLLALHAESAGLVGIEGPVDEVMQLMDEGAYLPLMVISIVGFGGLGKTTLANEIYCKLDGQFQYRAIVPVSQKPNIPKILKSIMSQFGVKAPADTAADSKMEIWDQNKLITSLRAFLRDKKYFIVIDDIWDAVTRDTIKSSLPENMKGSRVIITTRIESVARSAHNRNHTEFLYKMRALSDEDSSTLFFKRIFGSEACPPHLQDVSAEILKKCGGLPLALTTISSLLANQGNNNQRETWEYVRTSLANPNFEGSDGLEGMRKILKLSYINLPHRLKTCMLYLGIYPEDYRIDKNDLVGQWVAEGYIEKGHGIEPEDVARVYFNELINWSIIQPINPDYNGGYYNGEVISCRVHDMIRDLILHQCREENFITVIDGMEDLTRQQDKIRRLSLNLDGVVPSQKRKRKQKRNLDRVIDMGPVELSQIRTIAMFSTSSQLPPFPRFKHLRVILVEISNVPRSSFDFSGIGHLFQLRCLKIIAHGHAIVLPNNIGSLNQLEMFEIEAEDIVTFEEEEETCDYSLDGDELPPYIGHMTQLRHLIVPGHIRFPKKIGDMKSLRTLRYLDMELQSSDSIESLRELTNLTDIEICYGYGEEDSLEGDSDRSEVCLEVLSTCLEKLCKLKSLVVHSGHSSWVVLDALSPVPQSGVHHLQRFVGLDPFTFSVIPEWIGQYHRLYELNLAVEMVLEDDLELLAPLPSLIHLELHITKHPRKRITVSGSGFPVLKQFTINCSRISYLAFEPGAMARLERLSLGFSQEEWDNTWPAGMQHLLGLKEISVEIDEERPETEVDLEAAKSLLMNNIEMHPSRPTVTVRSSFTAGLPRFSPNYFEVEDGRSDDSAWSAAHSSFSGPFSALEDDDEAADDYWCDNTTFISLSAGEDNEYEEEPKHDEGSDDCTFISLSANEDD